MAGNDLELATREMFVRSVKQQTFAHKPFFEEMMRRNQIKIRGGKYIERLVDVAEMDDVGQSYTVNEALTQTKKDMLDKPRFTWKYYQMPLQIDADEETENIGAGDEEQLLDLAQFLTRKATSGVRIALAKMLYNVNPMTGAGSETGVGDSSKYFQSLLSAMDHDVTTYGNISRAVGGSNTWWLGSDPEGRVDTISSSSQGTSYSLSMSMIRKWMIPLLENMEKASDMYLLMCPTLWNKIKAELESYGRVELDKNSSLNFGIQKFKIDGVYNCVADPYLEHGYGTSGTTENWFFMLNMADWEVHIHSKRNFKMTPWKWQGELANGYDYTLCRILVKGNFVCWKPNGSLWLYEVS